MYGKFVKRFIDLFLCILTLPLSLLLISVLSMISAVKLGTPVIFKQKRPGKNGRIFTMYKFRTMTDEKDADGNLLPDEQRLTAYGNFLRKTSLDELPEIFNVIKGDMSIIGPRPLLVQYLPLYNERQKKRHNVRPGITGYAQVNGRNLLKWEEKFEYDVYYTEHICFSLDVSILFKTVFAVFGKKGISSETSATMEPFCGTPEAKGQKIGKQ